jgi:4a-hydroxytetrahydrobiopterin dehydratase
MDLTKLSCQSYKEGTLPLNNDEINEYRIELKPDWNIIECYKIEKEFTFQNFQQTMNFVNRVADLAEEENHHPVMHVFYGKVTLELWTHSVSGLSPNDFILAAKIDVI